MEIEGTDGSKTPLKQGSEMEFGRSLGFKLDDRNVSRRHVSFQLHHADEIKVCFRVIGKNPIWVHSSKSGEVNTFRTSERGEMEIGDVFCVSAKNPILFTMKRTEFGSHKENHAKRELGFETELRESLEIESSYESNDKGALEPESVDISQIDPVKEFGFLVIGHEFGSYPKNMIRDIKNWDWFIEEGGRDSEEFEEKKRKKGGKKKRKKSEENDDEEWTGESEEEKEQTTKAKKVQRPKYFTRSKDRDKPSKDTTGTKAVSAQKRNEHADEEEDEDDEDDETLGGFIVDNDELEQEEDIDEEEGEEFDEEDDEEK